MSHLNLHESTPTRFREVGDVRLAYRQSLLLDSGGVCSRVVREAQRILRLLKNKGFKEESMTKVGVYAIGTSTTLESNKSQICF